MGVAHIAAGDPSSGELGNAGRLTPSMSREGAHRLRVRVVETRGRRYQRQGGHVVHEFTAPGPPPTPMSAACFVCGGPDLLTVLPFDRDRNTGAARPPPSPFAYCYQAIAAGYGPYIRGRERQYAWYTDGDGRVCE